MVGIGFFHLPLFVFRLANVGPHPPAVTIAPAPVGCSALLGGCCAAGYGISRIVIVRRLVHSLGS